MPYMLLCVAISCRTNIFFSKNIIFLNSDSNFFLDVHSHSVYGRRYMCLTLNNTNVCETIVASPRFDLRIKTYIRFDL